jgi:hypothetical protein
MVSGIVSLLVRLRAFSTADYQSCSLHPSLRSAPTFVAMVVAQPRGREGPRVQHLLEAIDDQRFPADYHVEQHELLELLDTVVGDHLIRDAVHILEVLCLFDESSHIKVWRDGLE